ncbi:hypothetical protein TI39_contig392g00026 [Zymoseptoria brevis]|uniref:BTB domain-containing protein n=1 Tax=Zymoseptoria brevis TaxID=1047168 RepID=A0A0F4GNC9_9PEZI|nr:hypothetical protein TI39_contig392g00026 [Zymoseptoria brevis]
MALTHDPSMSIDLAPSVDGDFVTVLIGKNERKFFIHEAPLRAHSRFFDAAMSGAWKESAHRILKLPVEQEAPFKIYIRWVYTNKTSFAESCASRDFAELYIMASRLQDGECQGAAIDCIIRRTQTKQKVPNEHTVNMIYSNTLAGDPARRLCIDCWVIHGSERWFENPAGAIDAQFYKDVAKLFCSKRNGKELPNRLYDEHGSTCRYHQHGEGECYGKKYAS